MPSASIRPRSNFPIIKYWNHLRLAEYAPYQWDCSITCSVRLKSNRRSAYYGNSIHWRRTNCKRQVKYTISLYESRLHFSKRLIEFTKSKLNRHWFYSTVSLEWIDQLPFAIAIDGFPFGAGKLSCQKLFAVANWMAISMCIICENGNGHLVFGFMFSAPVIKIEDNVEWNKLKMSNKMRHGRTLLDSTRTWRANSSCCKRYNV